MQSVYFLESGMVSVSAKVEENRFVAAWLVGSEGMIGAPLVLAGEDRQPVHRRIAQVGGTALRLAARIHAAAVRLPPFLFVAVFAFLQSNPRRSLLDNRLAG
jgi:hypothetical protein